MSVRYRPCAFVYVAERDGRLKIGTSINPDQRAKTLKARLLAATYGGYLTERLLHRRFDAYALHYEWFQDVPPIREMAASWGPWDASRVGMPPATRAEFGERIRYVREMTGFDIHSARLICSVTGEQVAAIERGEPGVPFDLLHRIGCLFEVGTPPEPAEAVA